MDLYVCVVVVNVDLIIENLVLFLVIYVKFGCVKNEMCVFFFNVIKRCYVFMNNKCFLCG